MSRMWKLVKQPWVESAREVCGLVRVGRKYPKNVWQNDVVKSAIERKEDTWNLVLGAEDEVAKGRYMEVYKEEKREVKRCIYRSKKRGE